MPISIPAPASSQKAIPPAEARSETDLLPEPPAFLLSGVGREICAAEPGAELPRGPLATLPERASAFFTDPARARLLVGAIPFDNTADDYLFAPAPAAPRLAEARIPGPPNAILTRAETPSRTDYGAAVAAALRLIDMPGTAISKVVLARSLRMTCGERINVDTVLRRLRADPSITTFCALLPGFTPAGGRRRLVGATPELLIAKTGSGIVSHPLAGSARRHVDPTRDSALAAALLRSEKDQREHRAVAETVLDALSPFCSELSAPEGMTLRPTATIWHLGTRIVGTLRDKNMPVAELVAALHPTPAVCGLPRDRAAEAIRMLEGADRGFYAGAVGWMDDRGDGSWHVSIRCAEIADATMTLFAGAGIVTGSDPAAEIDETAAKFLAMLRALGLDETEGA